MSTEELAARVRRVLTMTASSWDNHAAEFDVDDPEGAAAWRSAADELREVRDRLAPPEGPDVSGATCRHQEARLPAPSYLEQETGGG